MKKTSNSSIVSVDVGTGYNDSSMSIPLTSKSDRNFKALPNFYHSIRFITNFSSVKRQHIFFFKKKKA